MPIHNLDHLIVHTWHYITIIENKTFNGQAPTGRLAGNAENFRENVYKTFQKSR